MVREKDSFWRSFFHPCVMRGQDDVTALEAQRVQIRGTPTTGLKKSSLWHLFAFWRYEWLRFGRKRRAKCPQQLSHLWAPICDPWSTEATVGAGGVGEQWWKEGGQGKQKLTSTRATWLWISRLCAFPASSMPLPSCCPQGSCHPLWAQRETSESSHEANQPQSLTWSCVHWSQWGPGRDSSSGCRHHPLETAGVADITGSSRLVPCVHTRQRRQWDRGAECKGDSTRAYVIALTLTSVCLGQDT